MCNILLYGDNSCRNFTDVMGTAGKGLASVYNHPIRKNNQSANYLYKNILWNLDLNKV